MSEQVRVTVVHQYAGPKVFVKKPVAYCCRCGKPVYNVLEWIARAIPENWLCIACSGTPEGRVVSRVSSALVAEAA